MKYTHTTYGLGVAAPSLPKLRYNKKSWVPKWVWKLVSDPDMNDLILNAMIEADNNYKELMRKCLTSR